MGYLIEISFNNGISYEVLTDYSTSSLRLEQGREDGSPRVRDLSSYDLTVFGTDYQRLLQQKQNNVERLPMRLGFDSGSTRTVLFDGVVDLIGRWNYDEHTCTLGVEPVEDSYNKLLQGMDTVLEIRGPVSDRITLKTVTSFRILQQMREVAGDQNAHNNNEWTYVSDVGNSAAAMGKHDPTKCYKACKIYKDGRDKDAFVGDVNESFCYVKSGNFLHYFACIQENLGASLPLASGRSKYWVECHITAPNMWNVGQKYSDIYFQGAYYDSDVNQWVTASSSEEGLIKEYPVDALSLDKMIKKFIDVIDNTITIDVRTYFNSLSVINSQIDKLVLFRDSFPVISDRDEDVIENTEVTCDMSVAGPMFKLKFKDLIEQIETMFNVKWYLTDGNEFRFLHPSEDCRQTATTSDAGNIINNIKGHDYTPSEFNDSAERRILAETWQIGTPETDVTIFQKFEYRYDTPYKEINDYSVSHIQTDVATTWRKLKDDIVIIAVDSSGYMHYASPSGTLVFNDELSNQKLVSLFHAWDRPYSKAKLKHSGSPDADLPTVTLNRKRDMATTIRAPHIPMQPVNFRKMLTTSNFKLQPLKVIMDIESGTIEIEAAK